MRAYNAPVVEALLAAGADVHATDESGLTALHYAALKGRPAGVICRLVAAGADVTAAPYGVSPYEMARDSGHVLAAALLQRIVLEKISSREA
jgi:ankyrin repeat protein